MALLANNIEENKKAIEQAASSVKTGKVSYFTQEFQVVNM